MPTVERYSGVTLAAGRGTCNSLRLPLFVSPLCFSTHKGSGHPGLQSSVLFLMGVFHFDSEVL